LKSAPYAHWRNQLHPVCSNGRSRLSDAAANQLADIFSGDIDSTGLRKATSFL